MSKFRAIALLFFIFVSISCQKEILTEKNIEANPAKYTFSTEPTSYQYESFPSLNIDRDTLKSVGVYAISVNNQILPDPSHIIDEFVITQNDSFEITILNCKQGKPFMFSIDGNSLLLAHQDTLSVSDTTYVVRFVFNSFSYDKGYIGFAESTVEAPSSVSSESPGFVVGYNVGVQNDLWLNIDKMNWEYQTEGFSRLSVLLQGMTNAYRIKIETYGDGLLSCQEILVDDSGNFCHETVIAFSHQSGIFLKTNVRLGIYGTFGLPKVIELENPKND